MKSFLGVLFTLLIIILVVGGGAVLYYLSTTTEFSRKGPAERPTTLRQAAAFRQAC